jgi:hypothetical protein
MKALVIALSLLAGTAHSAAIAYWPLATNGNDLISGYTLTNNGSVGFATIGGEACAGDFSNLKYFAAPAGFLTAWGGVAASYNVQFYTYQSANQIPVAVFASWTATTGACGSGASNFNLLTGQKVQWEAASVGCANTLTTGTAPTGQWVRINYDWDGTTRRTYINGSLDPTTSTHSATFGSSVTAFRLGNYIPGSAYAWNGYLRDVVVYNSSICTGATCAEYVPPSTRPTQLSPYILNSNSPRMMPLWWNK